MVLRSAALAVAEAGGGFGRVGAVPLDVWADAAGGWLHGRSRCSRGGGAGLVPLRITLEELVSAPWSSCATCLVGAPEASVAAWMAEAGRGLGFVAEARRRAGELETASTSAGTLPWAALGRLRLQVAVLGVGPASTDPALVELYATLAARVEASLSDVAALFARREPLEVSLRRFALELMAPGPSVEAAWQLWRSAVSYGSSPGAAAEAVARQFGAGAASESAGWAEALDIEVARGRHDRHLVVLIRPSGFHPAAGRGPSGVLEAAARWPLISGRGWAGVLIEVPRVVAWWVPKQRLAGVGRGARLEPDDTAAVVSSAMELWSPGSDGMAASLAGALKLARLLSA